MIVAVVLSGMIAVTSLATILVMQAMFQKERADLIALLASNARTPAQIAAIRNGTKVEPVEPVEEQTSSPLPFELDGGY